MGETMNKLISALAGFCLAAYASMPAYAFTPLQTPILSTAAVTPNVMIMLDNSGSMDEIIWHDGYSDAVAYGAVDYCNGTNGSGNCDSWAVVNAGSSYRPNNFVRANCPSSSDRRFRVGLTQRCMTIYDPVGGNNTRYKGNYIRYVVANAVPNSALVNDYRMRVAREVTKSIVANNRGLRYGLFSFNTASNQAGGSLLRDVKNFSESKRTDGTVEVTTAQAQTNYDQFVSSVNGLTSSTWTPLSEAYYEVTRYFRGMSRFQGSGSGNYTSPIQYRCQRNFGIVVTDGLPTYDRTFPNNDPLRDNPAVAGGNNLPNWDGVNNDGNNLNGDKEGDTLYLDDVAQFGYDVDLRDISTADQAGKSFNDPGFLKQNLFTYTVGFAVNNSMLADAAAKGRGVYYTAGNSAQLNDSLSNAINEISAKAGSGGAGASSSATLTTATYYYKTLYNPEDWRGTIEAYLLNPATGRPVSSTPNWTTDTTITPANNGAQYQTYVPAGTAGSVVSLTYANLSAAQQAALNGSVAAPVTGAGLIDWVKGNNVTGLRARSVLLGDVINSSLERLSPEEKLAASLESDTSYESFLSRKSQSMTSSLLVNANDGLFHVINADTGRHRYGYLPSSLMPSLHIVADPDYATDGTHKFMSDGLITVADGEINSIWSTVAVSGMGAGGKSVFAVKLFDDDNDIQALWEVSPPAVNTPTNDWNDLGYTYSKPVVARIQGNRWVAIFGNGYGSYQGKAALYVVDLADGELVQKIVVDENNTGTPAEIAAGNGLSSPQIVVDAQNRITAVYAGDMRGNLWAFDLSSSTGRKLFAAGEGHPITAQPLVVEHPEGGYLALFGTGKLSEASDKLDKTEQAFYAIWDQPSSTTTVSMSDLLAQRITEEVSIRGEVYLKTSTYEVDWNVHKGWYLPLVYQSELKGERVIYPAQTTLNRVIFVTAKVDAADPCESSGSGRLAELDLFSGSMLTYPVLDTNGDGVVDDDDVQVSGININDGLPGLPVIIDRGDDKPTQTKIILLSTGVAKFIDEKAKDVSWTSKRIMWRQLQ